MENLLKIPSWRSEPLNEAESGLLSALFQAHDKAARRQNISSVAVSNAAQGSGSYTQAIASALMTIGGPHGPVIRTFDFLSFKQPYRAAEALLDEGLRVPGWGSSFVKGGPDPDWHLVREFLYVENRTIVNHIDSVTGVFASRGKNIFPNPAAYTAATAITLGIPAPLSPWLFIQGRLAAWTEIAGGAL